MNLIASNFVMHPVISVNEATSGSEPIELLNGKMISDAPVVNDYGMQQISVRMSSATQISIPPVHGLPELNVVQAAPIWTSVTRPIPR